MRCEKYRNAITAGESREKNHLQIDGIIGSGGRDRMVRQVGTAPRRRSMTTESGGGNVGGGGGTGSNSTRGQVRQQDSNGAGSQRGLVATPAPTAFRPRQMIRVQRSEPKVGIVRNELRFVSYAQKHSGGDAPVETHVVAEAFGALIVRLRELNIHIPGFEPSTSNAGGDFVDVALLKDKLASSEAECERLRQIIDDMRKPDAVTSHEPEWVRIIEGQLRAVSDQLNPLHSQAQRFSPQIADLKAHMRHILEEIHENRLAGKLTDDRVRQDIHAKLEQCRHIAADTISAKRR